MGWLCSRITFPVSYLILVLAAGSGSVEVLHEPTCTSDYINVSPCEWRMDRPTNCSAELRLTYQLNYTNEENHTCIPENRESTVCVCYMLIDVVFRGDVYKLKLWAGTQLLWNNIFIPSNHVKPLAPVNLTVHTNISSMWLLTWSNPYPPENGLYQELTYLVHISNENDPTDVRVHNVTYQDHFLNIPASTLKAGATYSARVKSWSRSYDSGWSDWSPSARWHNYFQPPLEQRLPLGVSISCVVIVAVCLSCYFGIIKIKKEWWDQIPNPAHSPLVAIVIQDPQVSLWGKRSGGQEPAKCPHWKTCLTKLLPCLLEHGREKDESGPKAARNGPFQGPGISSSWCPVEISKTVLWPESISVVRCVELFEAPEESEEEEEVEDDKGNFCASPKSSGSSFLEGREGIAARLTENLFLDLLGGEDSNSHLQGLQESCLPLPSGSVGAQMPQFSSEVSQEDCQGEGSEPDLSVTRPQSPSLPFSEMHTVVTDNPAYRSFSPFRSQPLDPAAPNPDPQLSEHHEEGDPGAPSAQQPLESLTTLQPEPETWEQILRQSVLQHRTAVAPAPLSDYREFVRAVEQGATQEGVVAGFGPTPETGYKAFSSLLPSSATCSGTSGVEDSSGDRGYRPLRSLTPGCPGASLPASVPLFTFGLDVAPPHSPQHSLPLDSCPECPSLEPVDKGEDCQKPPATLGRAADALRDDLASGIIYSALTCHLCGHLKQCHGQEEQGEAHAVAAPCCGCRCGDRSSPPVSPLDSPGGGGLPLEVAPLGVSEDSKPSRLFQPAPGNAQSSSQTPKMAVVLCSRSACMATS